MQATATRLPLDSRARKASSTEPAVRFGFGIASLGAVLVAASDLGLVAVLLGDEPDQLSRDLEQRLPGARLIRDDSGIEQLVTRVLALLETPTLGLEIPLDPRGTAFQRRVWDALRTIPVGTTATYSDIARQIGAPGSVRAVARACGANPLAVAIPCHRVVRQDGGISGYRWGIHRKRVLLAREARS